ncbi:MAG TPA: 16S rRNA (adenine(1518)-N(6)/adenine(1519)-N(6))-dimethyltransferase RsmA [Burkholderiaceae bacterium]|nr:16S rRNA (adenine(1518)-N(6)/adenine(1519)-N(6))-dimethyltransferase RsmA [Burkholderiaceae bacterium]
MAHRTRKRFGQHFLHDEGVIEQIVRAIRPRPDDTMVEIGPGLSALTAPLLHILSHLTVIEIDRDLAAQLVDRYPAEQLTVIAQDALEVDFSRFGDKLRIVGNLPYNVSTPLLFHLTRHADQVLDQHFMLQKEVVMRLTASPSTPDYSRLSVMLQARYHMDCLFDVTPLAFEPPPAVVSAVVRMIPLPASHPRPVSWSAFEMVVTQAFSQRRKMLRRALAQWVPHISWQALGIVETARAQDLSVEQFIALSDFLVDKQVLPGS